MKTYKYGKRSAAAVVILCLVLNILFAGCSSNEGANNQETTQDITSTTTATTTEPQTEDYSTKKAVSGAFFAERAAINGFGTTKDEEGAETYGYRSHYFINFGSGDNCEYIEAKDSKTAQQMFADTCEVFKMSEGGSDVVSATTTDKGHYKKYVQQQKNLYIAVICLDNTYVLITSSVDEQPRYEVFLKDINY